MNLEESDSFKERLEKNSRQKRGVVVTMIFCAFAIVILAIMIGVIKKQDAITMKVFVDKKQISIPENFYIELEGGEKYVNLAAMAQVIGGYKYNKGEYETYNETEESCYLQNDFEVLSVTAESPKYSKYVNLREGAQLGSEEIEITTQLEENYREDFVLEKPVKLIEGVLFASIDNIEDMFNISIDWENPYRLRIYSLDYIVANTLASLSKNQNTYTNVSFEYENLRAMRDSYAIVGISEDLWGVISTANGTEVIGTRYKNIQYVQNVKEFFVTSNKDYMGIANSTGKLIVALDNEYDKIELLDAEQRLYKVEKESQYGVINSYGDIIVHIENDEIGVDSTLYNIEDVKAKIINEDLLLGKYIPAKKKNADGTEGMGLYNLNGELVLSKTYELGYISTATTKAGYERSVLIIPETVGINGIVISRNGQYGIFDGDKESMVLPCVCSKIYSKTQSGETTYYIEYNGQDLNLKEYLIEIGVVKPKESPAPQTNTNIDDVEEDSEENVSNTTSEDIVQEDVPEVSDNELNSNKENSQEEQDNSQTDNQADEENQSNEQEDDSEEN